MLFLHSAPSLESSHDYELIAERTLNTYILGEHVAPKWELGRVLKWSPVKVDPEVDSADGDFSRLSPKVSRSVGLYKVQGSAVEAVVGGIYHQHGGDITHRIFHTRILPHILLPGTAIGLNDVFHEHAMRLYGLFKYLTISHSPNSARPSIFNITGRAKWDAWKQTETTYGERDEEAEERYLQLARELGWVEGTQLNDAQKSSDAKPSEDDEDIWDNEETSEGSSGGGLGNHVSTMAAADAEDREAETLHGFAMTGDVEGLRAILQLQPTTDLNEVDEYGYTPLHLASDRGHLPVVQLLLTKDVDLDLKDPDEFTAIELARIAEHQDIVDLLQEVAAS
ncbi:hypothetical protein EUX98_g660 [Antrodiella citrinella]|uniref:ACB domain-containing protein n=1 Tax=Antrodiella citrinella TaxID=2447956 RepID=A0A4S4N3E5_9APHY|nr:hypothetical protein EUX98_g660 [Antrodiella citrinella]